VLKYKTMSRQLLVAKPISNSIIVQKVLPLYEASRFHRSDPVRSLVTCLSIIRQYHV